MLQPTLGALPVLFQLPTSMSGSSINVINTLFSVGTLIFQAISALLIIGFISKDRGPVFSWLAKNAILTVFLVALSGLVGSLIYQYVIGFTPCVLCWYQRIVMYPIAIISLVALIKKHSNEIFHYSMVLAVTGLVISLYHNFEKLIGKDLIACDATGPSCLQIFVKKFGFIDIPVMSLTFFVLIILLLINTYRFKATRV